MKILNIFYKSLSDNTENKCIEGKQNKMPFNSEFGFYFKIHLAWSYHRTENNHKEMEYFQIPFQLDIKINKIA